MPDPTPDLKRTWGYDHFATIAEAKVFYRRCRRRKTFKLTEQNPACSSCGEPIFQFTAHDEDGKLKHPPGYQANLCDFYPGSKQVVAQHYVCAWESILTEINKMRVY